MDYNKARNRAPKKPRRSFYAPCYNRTDLDVFNMMEPAQPRRPRSTFKMTPVMWVLAFTFVIALSITAGLTYLTVRKLNQDQTKVEFPQLPGLYSAGIELPQLNLGTDQLQDPSGPAPIPWDGSSRVNVLVMGLDYRDWEDEGPSRTDTLLLFTLDPTTKSAGMLSIPRDLWVYIPGFDYGKINTAYFLGEVYDLPGGGPALAIDTVENLLDIEINYYAQIDFAAFEGFIDEIGGVEVNIPYDMSVDPLGPGNTIYLAQGMQTLDGPTALAYARNRDTVGGDFDRAGRQQQLILGIRDRILSLDMLPTLITRAPQLYQSLASGVHANLTLAEIVNLALEAAKIPAENISQRTIGPDQVTFTYSPDGMDILLPDLEGVLLLRDDIFFNAAPIAPAATNISSDLIELVQTESATISVLNATTTPGLASATTDYLRTQGLNVTITGNADETAEVTTLIYYTGKPYTVQFLVELLAIDPSNIYSRYDPYSQVDISIIIGADWVYQNPLP